MHTDFPASVSTSVAVAPPGPDPTTTTSKSGTAHLGVAPAARLHVAFVRDRAPAGEVAVPAVLRRAVRRLAGVLEQQLRKLRLPVEIEIVAERSNAVSIDVLPAAHRAVPLTLRYAA